MVMRIRFGLLLAAIAFIGLASGPALAATVYNVNIVSGVTSATGTITTDSTSGVLAEQNILDWDLRLQILGDTTLLEGPSSSFKLLQGAALTATASGLFFDFSSLSGGLLVFQGGFLGSGIGICFSDASSSCYDSSQIAVGPRITVTVSRSAWATNRLPLP